MPPSRRPPTSRADADRIGGPKVARSLPGGKRQDRQELSMPPGRALPLQIRQVAARRKLSLPTLEHERTRAITLRRPTYRMVLSMVRSPFYAAAYASSTTCCRVCPCASGFLSPPYRLRYLLAWDHALARAVLGVYVRVLLGFQRHRARRHGTRDGRSGCVHTATSCTNKASIGHLRTVQGRLNAAARRSSLAAVSSAISSHHTRRPDPSMHDVQPHAEALGRSRHGVASIRVPVWK